MHNSFITGIVHNIKLVLTNTNNRGFTLIELLVVISIIGVLSSVVLATLSQARAKAFDSRRKSELGEIVKALSLYFEKKGNYMETGSGCGYQGNGLGWFSYSGISYPKSMAQCLIDEGIVSSLVKDPTGGLTSTYSSGYAYMKYHCIQNSKKYVYLYAKLQAVSQSSSATNGTCCPDCDSLYGMNYYKAIY